MATHTIMKNVSSAMVNSTQSPPSSDTVPYEYENRMAHIVLAYLWPAVMLFGVLANTTNIVVFLKTRSNDSVTILLVGLSISDLAFLALQTPYIYGTVQILFIKPNPWPFDLMIVLFLLYWPSYTAYDISTFISVSLGLMRCACVTFPLKFKSMFTSSRTLKWLVFLVVLAVSLRILVLKIYKLGWRKNPVTNTSQLYLIRSDRADMTRINDIMNRGVIMYLAFVTMVACVLILSSKLYEASKIRRSSTAQASATSQSKSDKPNDQKMSPKDLQVVQSVTLVCTIFILSHFVFVLVSFTRLVYPEFNSERHFQFLFGIFSKIGQTCSYLNTSLNIFVYYNFNSKYRATLKSLVCYKPDK